ncbi:MAG: sensor histidine kinase [Streptomycetaceae bacterium]|nr:MAG: sensor histidine kinase [Streptomycetaceae bacterium]
MQGGTRLHNKIIYKSTKIYITITLGFLLLAIAILTLSMKQNLDHRLQQSVFLNVSNIEFQMDSHIDQYINSQFLWLAGSLTKEEVQVESATYFSDYIAQSKGFNSDTGDSNPKRQLKESGVVLNKLVLTKEVDAIARELRGIFEESNPGYLSHVDSDKFRAQYAGLLLELSNKSKDISKSYTQSLKLKLADDLQKDQKQFELLRELSNLAEIFLISYCLYWIYMIEGKRRQRKKLALEEIETKRLFDQQLSTAQENVSSLTDSNERNAQYMSTANHELRTPLTSILGYIYLLKDMQTVGEQEEYDMMVEVLERKSLTLLDTINDLLVMSKLENVEPEQNFELIELGLVCSEVISGFDLEIRFKGLTVNLVKVEQKSFRVLGELNNLERAVSNLVSNAIKYSNENKVIDISLAQIESSDGRSLIELVVKDEGIGVPAEEVGKLFEKFYRASNSGSSGAKGSGLGLAITRNIIESFGGTIIAESVINQGTSMTVRIPEAETSTEKMVEASRVDVLKRAIAALESCKLEELTALTHKLGGTIGFYTFDQESQSLLEFSRWLKETGLEDSETIAGKKERTLKEMREKYAAITSVSDK